MQTFAKNLRKAVSEHTEFNINLYLNNSIIKQ